MSWEEIQDHLAPFTTDNIIDTLVEWDLLHNWWFIIGVILLAVICHFLRQRLLTAIIVMLSGIAVMISYTFSHSGTSSDIRGDNLMLFVGTGAVIVASVIYLLFVKED